MSETKSQPHRFWQRFTEYRYSYLFFALLALLVATAFFGRGNLVMPFFLLLLVAGVVRTLDVKKRFFRILIGFGLLAIAFQYATRTPGPASWEGRHVVVLDLAAVSCYIVFLLMAIGALFRQIFSEKRVTQDTIKGGVSVYFLFGIVWAFFYALIMILQPDAFSVPDASPEFGDLVYYSFVTLTTLGYGEILPVDPLARNLAILEASLGPIYLTVLIARLVGLQMTNPES